MERSGRGVDTKFITLLIVFIPICVTKLEFRYEETTSSTFLRKEQLKPIYVNIVYIKRKREKNEKIHNLLKPIQTTNHTIHKYICSATIYITKEPIIRGELPNMV